MLDRILIEEEDLVEKALSLPASADNKQVHCIVQYLPVRMFSHHTPRSLTGHSGSDACMCGTSSRAAS